MFGWFQRYRGLRKGDIQTLALSLTYLTTSTGLTLMQFAEVGVLHVLLGAIVIALGTTITAEPLVRGNQRRDREEQRKRRQLVEPIIESICQAAVREMSRRPDVTGCILYLPDKEGVLQTAFSYNKRGKPDAQLSFRALEGCAGHTWARGEQAVARLDPGNPDEPARTWKLSPEYVRLTAHVQVVVSTPIWSPDDANRMIGVITVDCEASDQECGIGSDESLGEALLLAAVVAHVLNLAELV